MRRILGFPQAAAIPILVCLQAISARPLDLSRRSDIASSYTLRSIKDQPKREKGVIDLEKKVKLLIGLCAGFGALLCRSLLKFSLY